MIATEIRTRSLLELTGDVEIELPKLTRLQGALLQANLDILDSEDVRNYKESFFRKTARGRALRSMTPFAVASPGALFVAGFLARSALRSHSWVDGALTLLFLAAASFLSLLMKGALRDMYRPGIFAQWQTKPLDEYRLSSVPLALPTVPQSVERKVEALSAVLPDAERCLTVEFLDEDPILWVHDFEDRSEYALAIW